MKEKTLEFVVCMKQLHISRRLCFSHGTKCAGVAASVKNNLCTVGVAYDATFAGKHECVNEGYTEGSASATVMQRIKS